MATSTHRQQPTWYPPSFKTLSLSSLEFLVGKTIEGPPSAKKCKLSLRSPNQEENKFFANRKKSVLSGQEVTTNYHNNSSAHGEDKRKYTIPEINIYDYGIPTPLPSDKTFFNDEIKKEMQNASKEVEMHVDDDDVFVNGHEQNKENYPRIRTRHYKGSSGKEPSCVTKARILSSTSYFGISPPAPNLLLNEAVCVNSPGRRKLQEIGLASISEGVKNSSGFDIKLLGKGGYGTVVLGSWKNMRVAVKVIARDDKMLSKSRRRTSIDSEMNATRIPEHENIVKVHGIFDGMEELHSSVIVMEYVGHYNLQNVIESQPHKLKKEGFLHCAVTEIGRGLNHCHRNGIIHLDIKPSNVLVIPSTPSSSWFDSCSSSTSGSIASNGRIAPQFKIGDFGCSKRAKQNIAFRLDDGIYESTAEIKDLSRPVGTPGYQAPEMLNGKGPITSKCDIYSYGIVLWQLLTRNTVPYPGIHQHTVIFKVVSQELRPDYNDKHNVNVNLKHETTYRQVSQCCWQQNYNNRPSMQQVLCDLENLIVSSPLIQVVTPNIKLGYQTLKPAHRIHRHSNIHEKRRNSSIRY